MQASPGYPRDFFNRLLDLSIDLLPPDISNAPLTKPVDLGDTISVSLADFLDTYGLIIQRVIKFESGRVTETRVVRTTTNTRRVELAWADGGHTHGQPLTLSSHGQSRPARPWIAEADGAIVESTFELVHGWDSALEGQPDTTYSRDGNSNFVPYANVYRLWVLNEDGLFSAPPYNRGPAFDLATLFNTEPLRPQLLTWKDNLTLDDTGARLPPIIEISTDAGQTWTSYPGIADVVLNRAAVYLDDVTLPAGYFAAAKAGQAKLRITASLQHPARMRILRWQRNPFTPAAEPNIFDLKDTFQIRQVDPQSIHYDDIQSGSLKALEVNETVSMERWLVERMGHRFGRRSDRLDRAKIKLAGPWPWLRVGDRIANTGGSGLDVYGRAEAINDHRAIIEAVHCVYFGADAPVTNVELLTAS